MTNFAKDDFIEVILNKIAEKKINDIVFWIILSFCMYFCAQISWKIYPCDTKPVHWSPKTVHYQKNDVRFNTKQIISLNLFGKLNDKSKKKHIETTIINNAPKTALTLHLMGVVTSTIKSHSLAIIENINKQDTYQIGNKIIGTSAIIKQIENDRVIILNDGNYETLMLNGDEYSAKKNILLSSETKYTNIIDRSKDTYLTRNLEAYKSDIINDVTNIYQIMRISPVYSQEGIKGYLLKPSSNPRLFNLIGLKSGDMAISINNYDLTNTSESLKLMGKLKTMKSIALVVVRNNEQVEIDFTI